MPVRTMIAIMQTPHGVATSVKLMGLIEVVALQRRQCRVHTFGTFLRLVRETKQEARDSKRPLGIRQVVSERSGGVERVYG